MQKHWTTSHPNCQPPKFHQVVAKQYKTCLARQIGEAVRIQLRGNVLNSAGVYDRCKLTSLVGDVEGDKKVRDDSWQKANLGDKVEQTLAEVGVMPNPNGERETGEK